MSMLYRRQSALEKIISGAIIALGFIALAALIGLLAAIPTYFLWNWLMPDIFGLTAITFWQAWGINWLASILFKSSSSSASRTT